MSDGITDALRESGSLPPRGFFKKPLTEQVAYIKRQMNSRDPVDVWIVERLIELYKASKGD